MLTVRALEPGDDATVRAIFRSTFALGRPIGDLPCLARYEALCLGWYLGPARGDVRLLDDSGKVVGYVLVGIDGVLHRRWVQRRAAAFVLSSAPLLVGRSSRGDAGRFVRLRLCDGWDLRRVRPPMPVHVHLNLLPAARTGSGSRLLAAHADAVCAREGAAGWFGEINARSGRRAPALRRMGGDVVHRAPNRTLTWLLSTPVERLTVVRRLPPEVEAQAA